MANLKSGRKSSSAKVRWTDTNWCLRQLHKHGGIVWHGAEVWIKHHAQITVTRSHVDSKGLFLHCVLIGSIITKISKSHYCTMTV